MAGRTRRVDRLSETSPRRSHRPRRRQDIGTIPETERTKWESLAAKIEALIDAQRDPQSFDTLLSETSLELELAPYQLLRYMRHCKSYHTAYPNEPSVNAFTPLLPGKPSNRRQKPKPSAQPEDIPFDISPDPSTIMRRRPHINSIKDQQEKDIIITYAAKIADLIEIRKANGGVLPPGFLDHAIEEITEIIGSTRSIPWLEKQISHLIHYRSAFSHESDYNDANAFTKLPIGRRGGRYVDKQAQHSEIREAIENAAINLVWPSFNSDGTVTSTIISKPLGPRMLHDLVVSRFGNVHSEATTWRIFDDYRTREPMAFAALRGDLDALMKFLPWINNKVGGRCERVQLDIRPLPIVVDYNGVACSVRAIVIVDDYSDFEPVWCLLPSKKLDTAGEILGQDYTCRRVRELLAIAMLRMKMRFRIVYGDNGVQFSWSALSPYMQFLVYPGEDPTYLINRKPKWARSGGNVEVALKFLNNFLQFRPNTYVVEEKYRDVIKNAKPGKIQPFSRLVSDFDLFMNNSNYEGINGKPSRYKIFMESPDRSLTLPSPSNLAVFAMTSIMDKRVPSPGGFHFQNKIYVPYRKDLQIYEALGNAVQEYNQSQTKIPVKLVEIGEYQMVFFSLDNEMSWEFAIEKGTDTITSQRHARIIQQVEDMIGKKGHEAAALCKTLLESAEEPLILNGLHRQPTFQSLSSAREEVAAAARDPNYYRMPVDLSEKLDSEAPSEKLAAPKAPGAQAPNANQSAPRKRRTKTSTQPVDPSKSHPVSSNTVSTGPAVPDDTEEFLRRLREELE